MKKEVPDFLLERLKKQYGEDITSKITEGYSKKRPVTLRINTIKSSKSEIEKELKKLNIEYEEVSFIENALIIKNVRESSIQELEIYKDGKIYLQSLSSMLPPIFLDAKENEDILDMAAAPGGKTTQIAALTDNKAHITACEMNQIRFDRLKYNVEKQGATSVYVMKEDSRKLSDLFSFDRILLDSPCSGSGTLYLEDENLEKKFNEKLIEKSTKIQYELLKKALKILKPGHEMIYSTCSILQEENEDIVNKVLKEYDAEIIPIQIRGKEVLETLPSKIEGTLCINPNELFEGFFIAKIKKKKA